MDSIIPKLLLIVVLWANNGEFKSSATEIFQCPNAQFLQDAMERRRRDGEFKSWVAWCTTGEFGFKKEIGV